MHSRDTVAVAFTTNSKDLPCRPADRLLVEEMAQHADQKVPPPQEPKSRRRSERERERERQFGAALVTIIAEGVHLCRGIFHPVKEDWMSRLTNTLQRGRFGN